MNNCLALFENQNHQELASFCEFVHDLIVIKEVPVYNKTEVMISE